MAERKVTAELADWIVRLKDDNIPAEVRKEGMRTFVNWVGCAVGGASHPTVEAALEALAPFSGPATATVLGRASGRPARSASQRDLEPRTRL